MNVELFELAERFGIKIEYWDFTPPLEAVYLSLPDIPPVIGLGKALLSKSEAYFRCVLAEELGHHVTTAGNNLPQIFLHYRDRLNVSIAEHRALRWAALNLIPNDMLKKAFQDGICKHWELAKYFDVTDEIMELRLKLYKLKGI